MQDTFDLQGGSPRLARRTVLGVGASIGAAPLLAACGEDAGGGPDSPATSGPPGGKVDVAELRKALPGKVFEAGDARYTEELVGFNTAIAHRPVVVVAAASAADVQEAVRFAGRTQLPVAVLATGHQGSVVFDGGLVISTRAMTSVTIDARTRTATTGPGVLWKDAVDQAAKAGLAPLAGSSPSVGVVGYTVGGGLSPTLGRAYGYAADHVTSIEVVTADGELRTATATKEPDLFWAVRGGKSNFGIVTSLTFGLFAVKTLYAGNMFFPGELAEAVLTAYATWTATVPDAMSSSVALMYLPDVPQVPAPMRGKLAVNVRVAYSGSAAKGKELLKPIRAVGPVLVDGVTEIPYTGFAAIHNDPAGPVPVHERTALLNGLPAEAIAELVKATGPAATYPISAVEVRHLGGALGRKPAVPNAVGNRDAAFTLFIAGVGGPDQVAAIQQFESTLLERMRPFSTGQTYLNFHSAQDAAPEQVRAAFDPQTFNRLAGLKKQYDPTNMFRLNHNIRPA